MSNGLDPDQDLCCVGPDLGPNFLTQIVFFKECFEETGFEKDQHATKKHWKIT